jgi:hypothetical protein
VGTEILLPSEEVMVPKIVVVCESQIQISPTRLHNVTTQRGAVTNKGHESQVIETTDLTLRTELVCLYAGNKG